METRGQLGYDSRLGYDSDQIRCRPTLEALHRGVRHFVLAVSPAVGVSYTDEVPSLLVGDVGCRSEQACGERDDSYSVAWPPDTYFITWSKRSPATFAAQFNYVSHALAYAELLTFYFANMPL